MKKFSDVQKEAGIDKLAGANVDDVLCFAFEHKYDDLELTRKEMTQCVFWMMANLREEKAISLLLQEGQVNRLLGVNLTLEE